MTGLPSAGLARAKRRGALVLAEVRRLEQLGQQDNLRPFRRGPADQRLGLLQIAAGIAAAGELGGGQGQLAHGKLPKLLHRARCPQGAGSGNTAAAEAGDSPDEPSATRNRGEWGRGSASARAVRQGTAREDSGRDGRVPDDKPRHRRAQRALRAHRRLVRPAGRGADQRRQCRHPLRLELQLQRLAGDPVVFLRRDLPALRRLHPAAQRACPHRRRRRPAVGARPGLDRPRRLARLPAADGAHHRRAGLAGVR